MRSYPVVRVSTDMTLLVLTINVFILMVASVEQDSRGYILYCPCMGRFGNQADQFLGSLSFARSLNRTLVLPPWVEYRTGHRNSTQVPFDTYFKVEPLRAYLRVITMETFMKDLAPTVWPPEERISFCFTARVGGSLTNDCNAKNGNPFGPFWDTFQVDFVRSEMFKPLFFNTESAHEIKKWKERYTAEEYPVLAFTGAPAGFPIKQNHLWLHKHLKWSDEYERKALDFIKREIVERPYIGIHLRNGIDFKKACTKFDNTSSMFASAQCMGYRSEKGKLTKDMCYPSDEIIIQQVKKEVRRLKAKVVFVATDDRSLIDLMSPAMKKVKFVKLPSKEDPHLDLALLGMADHFIGNCVSTFSAFVKRERDVNNLTSSFWAFKPRKNHDEL